MIWRAAAILAAVAWGTSWVATKVALESFDPISLPVWRGVGTSLIMATIVGLARWRSRIVDPGSQREPLPVLFDRAIRIAILGFLSTLVFVVAMTVAVERTGAAIAAFVAGLYPIIAAVMAPLVLSERLSRRVVVALGVALMGVIFLSGLGADGSVDPIGVAVGIAAATSSGLFLVLVRRWTRSWRLEPRVVVLTGYLMLTVAMGAYGIATGTAMPPSATVAALIAVVWLCVVSGWWANELLIAGVSRLRAAESSAYLLVNPVIGAALGALVLGEMLTQTQLVGAVCVVLALAVTAVSTIRS